jgi:hypothetical protein
MIMPAIMVASTATVAVNAFMPAPLRVLSQGYYALLAVYAIR